MAIEVVTKDCTALSDGELAELADLATAGPRWEIGVLGKQVEEWVLVSQARDAGQLSGFVFSTLERIGGTPAVVLGLGTVARSERRADVLQGLMCDQYHKARMAFPDEDVLVAARLARPEAFDVLAGLADRRPWPDTRLNGEERAWGRRLAKRYGCLRFDDRTLVAVGDGSERLVVDFESLQPEPLERLFGDVTGTGDGYVIAWGWAMAEFLDGHVRPVVG
jgi:hypothetical protein